MSMFTDDLARAFPDEDESLAALTTPAELARLLSEPHRFTGLNDFEKLASAQGLRDLYFAARDARDEDETASELARRVRSLTALFPAQGQFEIDGLSLSFHPTPAHKSLRFIDAAKIPPVWRRFFARPCVAMPELVALFADPEEFHFRAFENIIPLDRLFDPVEVSLRATRDGEFDGDAWLLHIDADDKTGGGLEALDALDLYLPPLNHTSRGGKRCIFHCAKLAEGITALLSETLPDAWREGFAHVNPVFRLNHFEPEDAPFSSHIDSPYRDPCRDHISRRTLLLYLTGGQAEPILRIGETRLTSIEPMTCVLFDQALEHEGRPYDRGEKIFLRTELIYEEEVEEVPWIGAMFAKACYLSQECIFADDLAPYMHDAYDRVAAARWDARGEKPSSEDEVFVHKRFGELSFIANGYDFWFDAREVDLHEAVSIAILDFFNCKVDGEAFGKRCERAVLKRPTHSSWIPEFLDERRRRKPDAEAMSGRIDKAMLLPPPEEIDPYTDFKESFPDYQSWTDYGDMTRCEEVVDLYTKAQAEAKSALVHAAIMLMGREIFLDRSRFIIEEDRVYVLTQEPLRPLHFAAMSWVEVEPSDFIHAEVEIDAPYLLVPPILYKQREQCIHLMFDFFRNSWMVTARERRIEVPCIHR